MLKPEGYIIHYGELALKGQNRGEFINTLVRNIELKTKGRVKKYPGRLYLEGGDPRKLDKIFGISWYASCVRVGKSLEDIVDRIFQILNSVEVKGKTFGLFVKRGDKSFKPDSQEFSRIVGQRIVDRYGMKVNLDSPDIPVFVTISRDVFIHLEKIRGLGGLPVGVTGKVLSLLSGGIDSPVASYLLTSRGCRVDFLHFHAFPGNEKARMAKVAELARKLGEYQNGANLYLLPYKLFQMAVFSSHITKGYEMILFRLFMFKVAERIARKEGCGAVVTGDSLSQVASQTLENISSVLQGCELPVFQPLIGLGKEQITNISRKIGTYHLSIQPYKECCSILSRNPRTRAKREEVKKNAKRLGIEDIVEKSLDLIECVSL